MNSLNIRPYQQCTRCVMDTTAEDIIFDKNGFCNYCTEFLQRSGHIIHESNAKKEERLEELVKRVKVSGKGKPYDCVVGISGGVDSSWTLVQVKRLGLRPIAVHMDNGWNSELAQANIYNLLSKTDVDFYTYVIDWSEYRALMEAMFLADVIDIELLYDNALMAVNYQQASKYGLKYIFSGYNQATEGMRMPKAWNWFKYDKQNILDIGRRAGVSRLRSFPTLGTTDFIFYHFLLRIRTIPLLDYVEFDKFHALDALEINYGYKRYPFKHYESIFTRFYQGYILPRKFSVDKRRLHLSTLVVSGQLTREQALDGLNGIPYPSENAMSEDLSYFLKKMGWTKEQLDHYISRPGVPHSLYSSEKPLWDFLVWIYKRLLGREHQTIASLDESRGAALKE